MIETPVGIALAAGVLAAVNPCGFALLPAYLALLVAGEAGTENPSRAAAVGRALTAAGAMTAGFAAVFGVFGLVISPVANQVQRHFGWFTIVLGLVVLAVGGWLLSGRTVSIPGLRVGTGPAVRRTWVSMVVFGGAYAVASLTCTIAPFLLVLAMTFWAGSVVTGVVAFLAYAAGMGLVVAAAALAVALSRGALLNRLRRHGPALVRAGGALLVVTGAYVAYYGWWDIRVFSGDADSSVLADPIIGAAAQVRGWLVTAVDRLGPGGLAVVVAVLGTAPLVASAVRRRRVRDRHPSG